MSAPPQDTPAQQPDAATLAPAPQRKRPRWVHVMIPVVTFGLGLGTGLMASGLGADDEGAEPISVVSPSPEPASTTPEGASTGADATAGPAEEKASPTERASPTSPAPDPENPRPGDVFSIGDRIQFAGMDITYTSVELTESIATVDGGTIEAEDGEVLVLLSSDFSNPGPDTVDLSCSGVHDAHIQMFDRDDNEIAPVFETYRLPGNPGCNDQLLVGQVSQWNTLWRTADGSVPAYITISDTTTWDLIAVTMDDDVALTIS